MADEIRIEDLEEKKTPNTSDIIIIEDDEDTKKTTLANLIRGAFLGDYTVPSELKFYSSQKVNQLFTGLKVSVGSYPTLEQFNSLKQEVDNIEAGGGTSNPEVVAARGSYKTLSARFDGEREVSNNTYLQYPLIKKVVKSIDMKGYTETPVTFTLPSISLANTFIIHSRNILLHNTTLSQGLAWSTNNLVVKQSAGITDYSVVVNSTIFEPKVPHYLYATTTFGSTFKDTESIKVVLVYSDGGTREFVYKYEDMITITPEKTVTKIIFRFNKSMIVTNSTVTFRNIMISADPNISQYVSPYMETKAIAANTPSVITLPANGYIYTTSVKEYIQVEYRDNTITGEELTSQLNTINNHIMGGYDHCGLTVKQGDYIFLDTDIINDTPSAATIHSDTTHMRNSHNSLKYTQMDYDVNTTPKFTKVLNEPVNLSGSEFITLQVYIDKPFFNNFTSSEGITISLSSDLQIKTPPTNYHYYTINKSQFVQGWNNIKIKLTEFSTHGSPLLNNVNQVHFTIHSSSPTAGSSIWLNALIIDQRIKPVILFAFEKAYAEGFDYQYPLLYTAGIPCTLFINSSDTFTNTIRDKIAALEYEQGWEIANLSCNPDKEILTFDDNARDQYLALRSGKLWLSENYTDSPISYAGPNGELRPITVPILKNLGYKIAKAKSDAYISFFSKDDFVIPMQSIDVYNTSSADIISRINYAIETGQALCLYTNNVTEYGSDIDANKVTFEAVVNHIVNKMKTSEITCMTFRDFYNKCVN